MTHIHPDSIRLLLRCGWDAYVDGICVVWRKDGRDRNTLQALAICRETLPQPEDLIGLYCESSEALALCRGAQPTPSVEEEK